MKKQFYLFTAGMLIVCLAHAQFKKGDVLLGGNFSFANTTTKGSSGGQTFLNISPNFGIATSENHMYGFNLIYGYSKVNNSDGSQSRVNTYGFGTFLRQYKALGTSGFYVFAEENLHGQYIASSEGPHGGPYVTYEKDITGAIGFFPGLAYRISSHIMLETGFQNLAYVQYEHVSQPTASDIKTNTFSLGSGLSNSLDNFIVGFKWLL